MKLFTVFKKPVNIHYKHQLCSFAFYFVLLTAILTAIIPYIVIHATNAETWNENLILFEQPRVSFPYMYLFIAELKDGNQSKTVTCSSFTKLKNEELEECSAIKFKEFDHNEDQLIDEMSFDFKVDLSNNDTFLESFQVILFLETSIKNLCPFQVPTALLLKQNHLNRKLDDGFTVTLEGRLDIDQKRALQCPFFMRKIKTHFDHRLIHENMSIDAFSVPSVRYRLNRNPTFFKYASTGEEFEYNTDESLCINVKIDIQEIQIRYNLTMWQRLNKMWVQYLAIFVIVFLLAEKMKQFMFTNQFLSAWEVEPWNKLK